MCRCVPRAERNYEATEEETRRWLHRTAAPRAPSLRARKERQRDVLGGAQDSVLAALPFVGSVILNK